MFEVDVINELIKEKNLHGLGIAIKSITFHSYAGYSEFDYKEISYYDGSEEIDLEEIVEGYEIPTLKKIKKTIIAPMNTSLEDIINIIVSERRG